MPGLPSWVNPVIGATTGVIGSVLANKENNKVNENTQVNSDRLYELAQQEQARRDAMSRAFLPNVFQGLGYTKPYAAASQAYPTQAPPTGTPNGMPAPQPNPGGGGSGIGSTIGKTALGVGLNYAKPIASAIGGALGIGGGAAALGSGFSGSLAGGVPGLIANAPMAVGPTGAALGAGAAGGGGAGAGGLLGMGAAGTAAALGGGAAAVAIPWLKSQAHWEANDAVKTFQNPFHQNLLAPLVSKVNSGQLPPEQGVQQLDQAWAQYQQQIKQWAGTSSDRTKVMQQSLATLGPIVEKIRSDMGGQ